MFIGTGGGGGKTPFCSTIAGCNGGDTTLGAYTAKGGGGGGGFGASALSGASGGGGVRGPLFPHPWLPGAGLSGQGSSGGMGRGATSTALLDPPPYSTLNGGAAGGGGGAGAVGGSDMFNIAGDGGAGVLPSFGGLLNDIYGQVGESTAHTRTLPHLSIQPRSLPTKALSTYSVIPPYLQPYHLTLSTDPLPTL